MTDQEIKDWTDRKAERRAKKARNTSFTLGLLRQHGYTLNPVDDGPRVRFIDQGKRVTINPGTGAWSVGDPAHPEHFGRGVYNMLHYLTTGEMLSREASRARLSERSA